MLDNLERWSLENPDKPAVWMEGAAAPMTHLQLHRRSAQVAQWLVSLGLQAGDSIAMLMENRAEFFELAWGARRTGLYYTMISWHLKPAEIAYVLKDCGARVLVTTPTLAALAREVIASSQWPGACFVLDDSAPADVSVPAQRDRFDPEAPLPPRPVGREFLYSSGTSGKPKGIRRPMIAHEDRFKEAFDFAAWRDTYLVTRNSIYLSPAPLYHAAPMRFTNRIIDIGGTVVVMPRFDAERALALVEQHRATHSQWVPTMMIRMLALPEAVRKRYDLSSMRMFIHAAAPCPPDVKRRTIEWWGPVVTEYYGGSETIGLTALYSDEALQRPGSVGRATLGTVHIVGADGEDLPAGEQGAIYFSGTPRFVYHNDPEKTAAAYDAKGRATYGDIGHLDADGYLYLSGRRTDLILSGGVNIYPQEIENLLAGHTSVRDVAVIGVPHAEFGEEVKAVVELNDPAGASNELAQALMAYCREHIAHLKCPRSVDFTTALPRQENGKLYKRVLMEQYAQGVAAVGA
ncbi:AMP-binding protein [Variovorax rhizosphaerae]|uniref:AMP-binding protein n=1 Tax=Variovorax rhizosphaerae TaxID=1836200 RepID=A0ABU8WP14_9BURK